MKSSRYGSVVAPNMMFTFREARRCRARTSDIVEGCSLVRLSKINYGNHIVPPAEAKRQPKPRAGRTRSCSRPSVGRCGKVELDLVMEE